MNAAEIAIIHKNVFPEGHSDFRGNYFRSRSFMKKYRFSFFILIMLTLLLSACSRNEVPQTADTTSIAPTATPTVTPTPTTPPIAPPIADKEAAYTKMADGCNLPIISIYTQDREEILSLDEYVECVVDVFNCKDAFVLNEIPAGIKVRGNSSAHYGDIAKIREYKAPYRIKFESKQNMLGLNSGAECKSWVLLKASWNLIPEDIAFRMARAIQDGHAFCSDSTFVHVYVNEEFHGVYLLCEQSQVHPNRVDINEAENGYDGTDIGYYMEIDNYAWNDPECRCFIQNYAYGAITDIEGVTRDFVPADYTIKSEINCDAQVAFIEQYMNNLYTALYEACINDNYMIPDADGNLVPVNYRSSFEVANALLDLESIVNMYILYEIVHDNDCGEGSFYMCIDFSSESSCTKLQFTSPWDFNWAYEGEPAGQYYAAAFCSDDFVNDFGDRSNPWFILLMGEDWFVDMVREKWTSLHVEGALEACLQYEEEYLSTYEEDLILVDEYAVENAYNLLEWIRTRIEWLDTQWLIADE